MVFTQTMIFMLSILVSNEVIGQNPTLDLTASSYKKAREILLSTIRKSGGLRAFQGIEDIQLVLKGTAYDEGQSATPFGDWHQREMNTQVIFRPGDGASYQKINTLTIGGLLYDPIFILNGSKPGMLHIPSSGEWFEVKGFDLSILKSIPQLYPPRMFPLNVMGTALRNAGSLRYIGEVSGAHYITFSERDGSQITMVVSTETNLLQRIEMLSDHLVYGDINMKVCYEDYTEVEQFQFPERLTLKYGEKTFMDLRARFTLNTKPDPSLFNKLNDKAFSKTPTPFVPKKLADGAWVIAVFSGLGSTYNVLLIEFDDHFAVFDAPLFDGYSRGVMQVASSMAQQKPIRYVIASHCHTDHIGGLGQYVASGATILCNKGNEAFIEELTKVKHTIFPNVLTFNPKEAKIEVLSKTRMLADQSQEAILYEIKGSPHVDEMIVTYLPKAKLLFVADLLMVSEDGQSIQRNESLDFLLKFIRKKDLDVDRLVPSHGAVVDMADVMQ